MYGAKGVVTPDWQDEMGCWSVSVPVKENLQALLGRAGSKCGDDAAPALPFTLIDQGQVIIAPKHTSTPNPQTSLFTWCVEKRSLIRHGKVRQQADASSTQWLIAQTLTHALGAGS